MQTNTGTVAPEQLEVSRPTAAMSIVTSLFFIWGFVTSLNDVLIPHLQGVFSLNFFQSMFIQFAFFSAYFIFALPWGKVVDHIGYRNTMIAGLVTAGIGCLLFVPAASLASFPLFLAALVILAGGITALQVAANPYVTALGPARTASSRLNLAQALNSLGTTIAPYLGGLLIFSAVAVKEGVAKSAPLTGAALFASQQQQASSVKLPYILLAIILFVLAVVIRLFHLPSLHSKNTTDLRPSDLHAGGETIWNKPQVLLATLAIFLYVGGEVSIGSFLVRYMHLPSIANFSELQAAKYVSFYWGGAMVGRFIGSALLRKFRTGTMVAVFALIAGGLVLTSVLGHGYLSMWTILSVGLFNSIMFPSIFTIGIAGLGALTSEASSLIVMAIVGGAIIPLAQGRLADSIGIQHALLIPLVCYVYIAFYGLWANKRITVEI